MKPPENPSPPLFPTSRTTRLLQRSVEAVASSAERSAELEAEGMKTVVALAITFAAFIQRC